MADLLIVDDDEDIAELLGLVLIGLGHDVRRAESGDAGIQMLRDAKPDLLVLDVEMPRLTGPEVAYQMLIEDAGMEQIPIVLVSGVVGLPDVAAAVGTPYFLAKPFAVPRLQHLVNRALEERLPPTHPGAPHVPRVPDDGKSK